jgi:serine/threonine protein kinase/tetratricopeptide (TPR) repeat protein
VTDAERHLLTLFSAALDHEAGAERDAYLGGACGGDAALRARIEGLLRAHEHGGWFLEPPPAGPRPPGEGPGESTAGDGTGAWVGPPVAAGSVIDGRYKLLQEIGAGGMGTVWLADQTAPVQRRVAVKLIRPGMDSRQVVARFEAERQALALMDHPNIARVLDGGVAEDGRPFFVMELVKGTPITRYCDDQKLPVRERLELFADVCRAVQHAHQKGIIHRDLKPSNVLVAPYDGKPVVKVIDFGVAKATGQQLTASTLFTGFGAVVGTPEYMSPEQAETNNQDIDTRSDIYALGVLLYELLTGTTPLTRQRVREAALLEVLRLVREEEPPRPSTRLSSTEELPGIAAVRGVEPARLSRLVRGELDWIVMKALEKDRNRRYESPSALAADVQRYLHDEPVQASPPSTAYRLRKFVRRHRGAVLAVSAIVLLFLAGLGGTTAGLLWALSARAQKEKALREMKSERDAKDEALRGVKTERDQKDENWRKAQRALRTTTHEVVEELLGRSVQLTDRHRDFLKKVIAYHEDLAAARADDPQARQSQAEGHFLVGMIRHRLGEEGEAETAYRQAVALQKKLAEEHPHQPDFPYDLALSLNNLGTLLNSTGRAEEAEAVYREGLALRRRLVADFPQRPEFRHELSWSLRGLGQLLDGTSRPREAEEAFREALTINTRLAADHPGRPEYRRDLARASNSLAVLLLRTGQPKEAEAARREAVTLGRALAASYPATPDYRDDLATSLMNFGSLLRDTGQPKPAEAAYTEALALSKQLAADFPNRPSFRSNLAACQYNWGTLLQHTGRSREAEAAWRDAHALRKQLAADYPNRSNFRADLAKTCTVLGLLFYDTARLQEAEEALRQAVALLKQLATDFPRQTEFHQDLALGENNLGLLLRATARPKEAEAAYREARTIQQRLSADFPKRLDFRHELAGTCYNLGVLLHTTGRSREAEPLWREAVALRKKLAAEFPIDPASQGELANTLTSLGNLLRDTERPKEAEAAHREAEGLLKKLVADFPDQPNFRRRLGNCYNNLGTLFSTTRPRDAEAAYRAALVHREKLAADFPNVPDDRAGLATALSNLAWLHRHQGEWDAALQLLERARPHFQAALAASPTNPSYHLYHRNYLRILAGTHLGRADHARLAATADELARCGHDPANSTYEAARYLCRCLPLVEKDPHLDETQRKEIARSYADQSLALLRLAVARGFRDAAGMRKDPALAPLRAREEFRKLLASLEGQGNE